jgi:membrane protein
MVIVIGARLNADTEHQIARETTAGPEKLGQRSAKMADTVRLARS